jgi:hypothetical protein
MSILQESPAAFPLSFRPRSDTVLVMARIVADRLGRTWASLRHERRVSRLPARLRYDIGEIDHLPPPPKTLPEIQLAYHQSPDLMRIRCQ